MLDENSFYAHEITGDVQIGKEWLEDFENRDDKDMDWEEWTNGQSLIWVLKNCEGEWENGEDVDEEFVKEFTENKEKFGSVHFRHNYGLTEVVIFQQPYLNDICGEEDEYTALGCDKNADEYRIRWPIIDFNCQDESDACNWDDYKIRKL